jgi:hypothetical protein
MTHHGAFHMQQGLEWSVRPQLTNHGKDFMSDMAFRVAFSAGLRINSATTKGSKRVA